MDTRWIPPANEAKPESANRNLLRHYQPCGKPLLGARCAETEAVALSNGLNHRFRVQVGTTQIFLAPPRQVSLVVSAWLLSRTPARPLFGHGFFWSNLAMTPTAKRLLSFSDAGLLFEWTKWTRRVIKTIKNPTDFGLRPSLRPLLKPTWSADAAVGIPFSCDPCPQNLKSFEAFAFTFGYILEVDPTLCIIANLETTKANRYTRYIAKRIHHHIISSL